MKKLFIRMIAALMLVSSLAGCGAAKEPVTSQPADTATAAPSSSTPEPETKEPVHLTFMHMKDAQGPKDALDAIFQEFTKQYPYITIEQQGMSPDQFGTIIKAKIASGDMPDIFHNTSSEFGDAGLCLDLSKEAFLGNINPETVKAANAAFKDFKNDGKVYALPLDNSCIGIYVNKKVLADNGLKIPTTLSEMQSTCDTLLAKGITPFAAGFKDSWTAMMPLIGMYAETVYAKTPDWDDQRDAGKVTIASDAGWKSAFDLHKQFIYGYASQKTAFDVDYNGSIAQFVQGKAAFLGNGLWTLEPIRAAAPDLDLDIIPFPVSDNPADNKLLVFPDTTIGGSSQSKHTKEIMMFLEFMTSKFAGDAWSKFGKIGSTVKGTSTEYDPIASSIQKYIEGNQFVTHGDRLFRPIFNTALWDNYIAYMLGESTWEALSGKLDSGWDQALEESKK